MPYTRYDVHLLSDRFRQLHAMQDLIIDSTDAISKPRKLSAVVFNLEGNFDGAPT